MALVVLLAVRLAGAAAGFGYLAWQRQQAVSYTHLDVYKRQKWDYYVDGKIDPRPVAWALNGYNYAAGGFENGAPDLLSTFANLKADGSTACGMWTVSYTHLDVYKRQRWRRRFRERGWRR